MSAIRIQDLRLTARGKPLLEGFSLSLEPGEHCTVTGPSGSGKSTLLKCLLGFARPEAGRISVLGQELNGRSIWQVRRRVAWVAQEPELFEGTAREEIERAFQYRANRAIQDWRKRLPEFAERFGMPDEILDQPVASLSGGEKQRLALIAALLLERPVLLLDEVSSALDPGTRGAVSEHLRGMKETTILSVAHDPDRFVIGGGVVSLGGSGGIGGPS